MQREDADVIVVGGGLTGLTAAFQLTLHGLSVEVLESHVHAGGVIGTHRHAVPGGDALYEAGPNSGMDTTPLINSLLDDLGIRDQRIDAQAAAAKRYVLRGGQLRAVPSSPLGFIRTPLFSAGAKLRLLREPFIAARDYAGAPEESVGSFVRRRLGPEFLDYAVEPFVGGVYAGDADQLSLPAAFPRLAEWERDYGGLVRGAILGARKRRREAALKGERPKTAAPSFNFKGGMQTLIDALVRHLPRLVCSARVLSLQHAKPVAASRSRSSGAASACCAARAPWCWRCRRSRQPRWWRRSGRPARQRVRRSRRSTIRRWPRYPPSITARTCRTRSTASAFSRPRWKTRRCWARCSPVRCSRSGRRTTWWC
jgi:protoporphyrinogen oxidase